jgi:hypothetical protein
MKQFVLYSLVGLTLSIGACKPDAATDPVPTIEFMSVEPSVVTEFQDSLTFRISYQDGDGDLGENDPSAENLYLKDSRNEVTYGFRIQQLAPTGSDISIQGELNVTLDHTSITDGSTSQTVTYEIWVVDRSGNQSNRVQTGPVTVTS